MRTAKKTMLAQRPFQNPRHSPRFEQVNVPRSQFSMVAAGSLFQSSAGYFYLKLLGPVIIRSGRTMLEHNAVMYGTGQTVRFSDTDLVRVLPRIDLPRPA